MFSDFDSVLISRFGCVWRFCFGKRLPSLVFTFLAAVFMVDFPFEFRLSVPSTLQMIQSENYLFKTDLELIWTDSRLDFELFSEFKKISRRKSGDLFSSECLRLELCC